MSPKRAPRLAAWMLDHLVPGDRNEALEGDLLEELSSGRSSGWYRRQVFSNLAAAWRRELTDHRRALLFATAWSMLAPVWMALVHTRGFGAMAAGTRRLEWPWSVVCPVALWMSVLMGFLWTGLLLFSWWSRSGITHFATRTFGWGFVRGTLFLMPVWLATVLLNLVLQANFWVAVISSCFPFFVAMLCGVWDVSGNVDVRRADRLMMGVDEPDSARDTEL